jgi:hypothetical protein
MLIISYGMPKTGSTLLFELTKALLEYAGYKQNLAPSEFNRQHPINFSNDLDEEGLLPFQSFAESSHLVLKTHSAPTPYVKSEIERGRIKCTVSIRDPRDQVLSVLDHARASRKNGDVAFSEFFLVDDVLSMLLHRERQTLDWLELAPESVYFYEEFSKDTLGTITQLASQFDITLNDPSKVLELMKGRFTQLNKGIVGRYQTELTLKQQAQVVDATQGIFRRFYSN